MFKVTDFQKPILIFVFVLTIVSYLAYLQLQMVHLKNSLRKCPPVIIGGLYEIFSLRWQEEP